MAVALGFGIPSAEQEALEDPFLSPADIADVTKLALKGAGAVAPFALGMFLGPKALGADLSLLRKAEQLEKKGFSPETILVKTGWFKGPDQKWRYEIGDTKAAINRAAFDVNTFNPELLHIPYPALVRLGDRLIEIRGRPGR